MSNCKVVVFFPLPPFENIYCTCRLQYKIKALTIEKSSNNYKLSRNKVKYLKTSLAFRFRWLIRLDRIHTHIHMDSTKPLNYLFQQMKLLNGIILNLRKSISNSEQQWTGDSKMRERNDRAAVLQIPALQVIFVWSVYKLHISRISCWYLDLLVVCKCQCRL